MPTPSFSRSNVNERTLYISKPGTSSFNLSHSVRFTPQLGRLHPVNCEYVIPGSVVSGGLTPELQLEKVITPQIGRTRLDTHSFLVPYRRIMNNFKQFVERRISADTEDSPSLPTFNYAQLAANLLMALDTHFGFNFRDIDEHIISPVYSRARYLINFFARNNTAIPAVPLYRLSCSYISYMFGINSFDTPVDYTFSLPNFFVAIKIALLADVYQTYFMLLNSFFDSTQFNYPSDFYAEQLSRIGEEFNRIDEIVTAIASGSEEESEQAYQNFLYNFSYDDVINTILFILEPYVGQGSNMDYLGYPIFRQYSDWVSSFFSKAFLDNPYPLHNYMSDSESLGIHVYNAPQYDDNQQIVGYSSDLTIDWVTAFDFVSALRNIPVVVNFLQFFSNLPRISLYSWSVFLNVSRLNPLTGYLSSVQLDTPFFEIFARSGYMPSWTNFPTGVIAPAYWATLIQPFRRFQSEIPLRAAYAAWFDRFRDWHIEPRTNCTDPDDWTLSPLIVPYLLISGIDSSRPPFLGTLVALLVPRYRYYSKDALLTVQTEDIYRHVYAPIFSGSSTQSESTVSSSPSDEDIYNRILDTVIDEVSVSFPSGSLHRIVTDSDSFSALRNDLQTMRRTGMLESWLARNYFYPDNYNGQIEAHYGVQVPDLSLLYCTYLGGDESIVTGDQVKAPVSTSEAPAGTRTFVGGAGHSDKFSFSFNDSAVVINFCSLVPLVEYDAYNSHLLDNTYDSLPFPEYASDARIVISSADMLRGFAADEMKLGYVPRYYHYRVRLDEVHGRYLTDLRSYSWFRDWYNMVFIPIVSASATNQHGFSLHPYCLRVHLPLDSFLGLAPWSSVAFGSVQCDYYVTQPLPAAVEYF